MSSPSQGWSWHSINQAVSRVALDKSGKLTLIALIPLLFASPATKKSSFPCRGMALFVSVNGGIIQRHMAQTHTHKHNMCVYHVHLALLRMSLVKQRVLYVRTMPSQLAMVLQSANSVHWDNIVLMQSHARLAHLEPICHKITHNVLRVLPYAKTTAVTRMP